MASAKILVIEDSTTMRQLLVFTLRRLTNVQVCEAADGVDGLKKLATEKFDLIVTDINMPILDGLKLVGMLRREEATRQTPIIVVTTEGAEEDRDRALELGANAYVTKPVQTGQLVELAKRFLPSQA